MTSNPNAVQGFKWHVWRVEEEHTVEGIVNNNVKTERP